MISHFSLSHLLVSRPFPTHSSWPSHATISSLPSRRSRDWKYRCSSVPEVGGEREVAEAIGWILDTCRGSYRPDSLLLGTHNLRFLWALLFFPRGSIPTKILILFQISLQIHLRQYQKFCQFESE